MFPQDDGQVRVFDLEFGWRVPVFLHLISREWDSVAEALDVTEFFHDSREVGVAVVVGTGLSKILFRDLAIGAAGVLYLNTIVEPVKTYRRVGILVGTMKYRVTHDLLEGDDGIIGCADLDGACGEVR